MSDTIITEWNFWIASVITGAGMSFAYDLLRLFRSLVHHKRIFVDIEDIFYWLACFFSAFTLLYYGNNGIIRFAAVFGAAVGMFIYMFTVGRFFVKYLSKIIRKITIMLMKIMSIILKPLLSILHKIKRKNNQILSKTKRLLTKI